MVAVCLMHTTWQVEEKQGPYSGQYADQATSFALWRWVGQAEIAAVMLLLGSFYRDILNCSQLGRRVRFWKKGRVQHGKG